MKIFKFITLGFIYLSMMFAFTSCDEKESELDNGKEIENEIENATTGTMPSLAQKQKIEQTGINFLNQIKATDFEQTFNLVNYISWKYSDYKTDEIEDWYEACFTAMVKQIGRAHV